MGSFWGHIDEGIFFILLAIWWTFHACHQFIEAKRNGGGEMRPSVSYTVQCCKKNIPVESILKILFPICGFMAEMVDGGLAFFDEQGNFRKLVYAQHMTIYGIFILHSIIDLLTWAGVPMIPGAAHLSAALSFTWYGVAFYYHAQMHGKEAMETLVHVIPVGVMFLAAVAITLECWWRSGVWTLLTRSYCLLTLGTWFSHVAFMLYEHDKFPGAGSSGWDRSDIRNLQYARACFGLHLLINMLVMLLCYFITYVAVRMGHELHFSDTYWDEGPDVGIRNHGVTRKPKDKHCPESFFVQDDDTC